MLRLLPKRTVSDRPRGTSCKALGARRAPFEQSPRAVLPRSLSPTCPAHAADAPAPCRAATPLPAARPPRADTATHSHQSVSLSVCQSASLRSVGQSLQLRTCCKASWFASRRRFADAAAVAAVPRTVLGQPTVSHGVVPSASTCLCAGTCADAACCSLLSQVGRFGSLQDTTNRVNRDKRQQIAASHLAFGATTAAARGRLRGLRVSAALASATATLETWQQLLQQLWAYGRSEKSAGRRNWSSGRSRRWTGASCTMSSRK